MITTADIGSRVWVKRIPTSSLRQPYERDVSAHLAYFVDEEIVCVKLPCGTEYHVPVDEVEVQP